MTAATSTLTTAPPPPDRRGRGCSWTPRWPAREPWTEAGGHQMDAHTIGLTRAAQARVVLLVVPPQATPAAAGTAMDRAGCFSAS